MKNYSKLIALSLTVALGACATIIEGETDRVELTTQQNIPAQCQLKNGRGSYTVNAPGSAEIKKSKTDLDINCQAADGSTGTKVVQSDMEGWFLGNIVIGGLIGGGIDAATGSMWEYPKDVSVNIIPAPQPAAYYAPAPIDPAAQQYAPAVAPQAVAPAQLAPQSGTYAPATQQTAPQQPVVYAPAQAQPQPQPINSGVPAAQLPVVAAPAQ